MADKVLPIKVTVKRKRRESSFYLMAFYGFRTEVENNDNLDDIAS